MNAKSSVSGFILVVDDEDTMRHSLVEILRLEGYRVQGVGGGEEAIEALKRENFDLLLLDLKMPGIDGLDVLNAASEISPQTKVIFLTAHGSLESAIEALRKEAYDYLLKPSSPAQILHSVSGALARRKELQHKRHLLELLDSSLKELKEVEIRNGAAVIEQPLITLAENVIYNVARRELEQVDVDNTIISCISLTPTEGKLLKVFLENRGRVFSHRELVSRVQGYSVAEWEAPEVLRPLVSRLRQKLSTFPGGERWISNVRGTGYLFETEVQREEASEK
jgi:DNA-binding response OmpR family regulator